MIRPALVCAAVLAGSPALAADPPEVALRKAEALAADDRPGEAEPLYLDAVRADDPQIRRQAYNRLMAVYIRVGRADKAVRLADPYRAWLRGLKDRAGEADLDALLGECYLALGHHETADKYFAAALAPDAGVSVPGRLGALRGRADTADHRRDAAASEKRWAELAAAARAAATTADTARDPALKVVATRYLAAALHHRAEDKEALDALAALPELHDKLDDPLGKRDTQRQRANLLSAGGRYDDAAPLFKDALELHRRYRNTRRMPAADILAEWAGAAADAGRRTEAARLRTEAEECYKAILERPAVADIEDGGPLAAFVKIQLLTREARQFRKALDLSRGAGERWSADALLEVRMKADRGGLELLASAYSTARTLLRKVLAGLDAADPPDLRSLPQVLVNLATAELAGDTPDKADPLLERCAALYATHKLPDDAVRAECEYLRGTAAAARGDYAAAARFYRAGLAVCETVGRPADPAKFNLLLSTALIHKDQGDPEPALERLTEAATVLATFAEPDDLSFGLIDAVRIDLHIATGHVSKGLALVERVEAVCAAHGVKGGYLWGTARHARALDLLGGQKVPEAEKAWAELADVQRAEGSVLLARTLNYLALTAERQGRAADALARYEEARQFQAARPWSPSVTRGITLWRLAILADKAGKKDEAKALLTEVADVADRARLTTFGGASQRAQFFAQFRPAFELLARWHARDDDADALVGIITRTRSRTLLDQMMAAGVDPRDTLTGPDRGRMLAREAEARKNVSRLRAKAQLLPSTRPDDPAVKELLAELAAAQKEFSDAWREIAGADPVTKALTDTGGTPGKRLPDGLGAKTAVVAYLIGRDESFAVLYTAPDARPEVFRLAAPKGIADRIGDAVAGRTTAATGLRGITVEAGPPQPDRPAAPPPGPASPLADAVAGKLVNQYLGQVANPRFTATRGITVVGRDPGETIPAPPELLGDAVLPPALRARLRATGANRLVVVPDGPLHKIPLECLPVTTPDGPRYAIDDLPAVAYIPSLGVLTAALGRPRPADGPATLLTVGNPAYPPAGAATLPPLPFTAVESQRVRGFFPAERVTALEGEAATERNVTAALPGKRFVHLAAHGFADDRFGNLFAAVALTPPPADREAPDDDGFLSLHEIYRLKLSGCDLTVLSACVTNVGPPRPLEAGVTLAGAFLCAGSRRVMATCWSVDDRATAELMSEFFRAVRPTDARPASYAESLRAARQKIRSTPGWESPFYWAPFVFVGPPD